MYPDNIYIKNHKEVESIEGGNLGVCLNKYDEKHGLKHDRIAHAQYKHWLSVEKGVPELLTPDERELLGL